MDALDVLKVCLRRWYVAVPVVLLSIAAGLGLALHQTPTYTAFASYALVYHNPGTSPEGREPQERNPLAADGAQLLGEALIADLMSGASQATFGGVGHSGTAPGEAKDDTSYSVTLPDYSSTYMIQTWGNRPGGRPDCGRLRPECCSSARSTNSGPRGSADAIAVHSFRHWGNAGDSVAIYFGP